MAKNRNEEMHESFDFGQRLSQVLSDRHITQKDLAIAIDETEVTVSRYLKGFCTPKATVVLKIARYLHVSMDYLYGNDRTGFDDLKSDLDCMLPDLTYYEKISLIKMIAK